MNTFEPSTVSPLRVKLANALTAALLTADPDEVRKLQEMLNTYRDTYFNTKFPPLTATLFDAIDAIE